MIEIDENYAKKTEIDISKLKMASSDFQDTLKIKGFSSNKELEKVVAEKKEEIKFITPGGHIISIKGASDSDGTKVYTLDYLIRRIVNPIGIKIEPDSIAYIVRCKNKIEGYSQYGLDLFGNRNQIKIVYYESASADISLTFPELERLAALPVEQEQKKIITLNR